jgi:hypothetical protein
MGVTPTLLWLWLWYPWPNGCLQQIAANRLTIPQDVIAILLQGFVRRPTITRSPPWTFRFRILSAIILSTRGTL